MHLLKMLLEICAVIVALKGFELFLERKKETWKIWVHKEEMHVDLWSCIKDGHMQWDLKEHLYWSWHFLVKVVKEMWVCCLLAKCWSEYLRMPEDAPADLQEELKGVIFLKFGVVQMQILFCSQRILRTEEKQLEKLSYMEKRQSRKYSEDRTGTLQTP